MKRYPMTTEGHRKLQEQLKKLKSVDRPAIIQAIAEARSHGDLKENAEYHAARERQGFIEGRIGDIEARLSMAEVIDVTRLAGQTRVVFGATVELIEVASGAGVTYQIVGEDEADIEIGLISISAPLARALIGKEEGDTALVPTPGGQREYEVVTIRYV